MKKMIWILACILSMVCLAACGNGKKAQEIYDSIGKIGFADESILTADEISRMEAFKDDIDKALADKDPKTLESLRAEWEAFRQPISKHIEDYYIARDSFFTEEERAFLSEEEIEVSEAMEAKIEAAYRERDSAGLDAAFEEWMAYSGELKDIIATYQEIDQNPFQEKELPLLSAETIASMGTLSGRTQDAFVERNLAELKSLQSEWYTFTEDGKQEIEQAKEKMLQDWVAVTDVGNSLLTLFSFGMIQSSTTIQGHNIIFTTQYNYVVDNKQIENDLNTYLNNTSGIFESGLQGLKESIDDVCIRIEYKDQNGKVVAYKEFK